MQKPFCSLCIFKDLLENLGNLDFQGALTCNNFPTVLGAGPLFFTGFYWSVKLSSVLICH